MSPVRKKESTIINIIKSVMICRCVGAVMAATHFTVVVFFSFFFENSDIKPSFFHVDMSCLLQGLIQFLQQI